MKISVMRTAHSVKVKHEENLMMDTKFNMTLDDDDIITIEDKERPGVFVYTSLANVTWWKGEPIVEDPRTLDSLRIPQAVVEALPEDVAEIMPSDKPLRVRPR